MARTNSSLCRALPVGAVEEAEEDEVEGGGEEGRGGGALGRGAEVGAGARVGVLGADAASVDGVGAFPQEEGGRREGEEVSEGEGVGVGFRAGSEVVVACVPVNVYWQGDGRQEREQEEHFEPGKAIWEHSEWKPCDACLKRRQNANLETKRCLMAQRCLPSRILRLVAVYVHLPFRCVICPFMDI